MSLEIKGPPATMSPIVLVRGAVFSSNLLMRDDNTTWPNPPRLSFGVEHIDATLVLSNKAAIFVADSTQVDAIIASLDDDRRVTLYDPVTHDFFAEGTVTVKRGVS